MTGGVDQRVAGPAVLLAAATAAGAMVAVQQRLNGALGTSLHDALLAALVSFATGLACVAAYVLGRRRAAPCRPSAACRSGPAWAASGEPPWSPSVRRPRR